VSLSVVKRFKPWRKTKPEWIQIDKDGMWSIRSLQNFSMKLEGMKNPGKRMKKLEKRMESLRITTLSAPEMTDVNPNGCGELDHPKEFLPLS
jgi:hypothetical protein